MSNHLYSGIKIFESPLFGLTSDNNLALTLDIGLKKLRDWSNTDDSKLYTIRDEINHQNNKIRQIEIPCIQLKRVQKVISNILHQVAKPSYLFCPVHKKSSIDNAIVHRGHREIRKIDIKSYYQSTKRKKVYYFFFEKMQCSKSVSNILASITTIHDHLPTGSPSSPILSYYAHSEMWDMIYDLVTNSDCLMSLYMDDLTVSGKKITRGLMWEIEKIIYSNGLKCHKKKQVVNRSVEVTGVIVSGNTLTLPNRKHLKIRNYRMALQQEKDFTKREEINKKLTGSLAESKKIDGVNAINTQILDDIK
jgi:hypothetical protein